MTEYSKMIETRELFVEVLRMVMAHFQIHEDFKVTGMRLNTNYFDVSETTGILIDFKNNKKEYTFDFFTIDKNTMLVKLIDNTTNSMQYLEYPIEKFFETIDIFTDFIF